jgi:hypothetical protein
MACNVVSLSACPQLCRAAEASHLEVVSCSLIPASTLGLPQHMHVPDTNPMSGKEQVVLVARKPLRG